MEFKDLTLDEINQLKHDNFLIICDLRNNTEKDIEDRKLHVDVFKNSTHSLIFKINRNTENEKQEI